MSFEVGQFLGSLFGVDEAVAVVDPPQPDFVAVKDVEVVEATAVSYLEYFDDVADDDLPDDIDLWPGDDAVDPAPCKSCEGLELWQNPLGEWKCSRCNPPTKAQSWLEKAERLRKRYGLPKPSENNQ